MIRGSTFLGTSLIALLSGPLCTAQEQADTIRSARNAVYLEALGTGGLSSVNYERVLLHHAEFTGGARIGFGSIHFKDFTRRFDPDFVVPIGVFGCYGDRFRGEAGAGITLTSIVYPDEETFGPVRRMEVHGWFALGARYQKRNGGLLVRIAYTPIVEFGQIRHWGGASLGYAF